MTPCCLSYNIFLYVMHLNLKATDFSPKLFCFSIRTFSKIFPNCFSCSCLGKERQHNLSFDKQSTQPTKREKCWEVYQCQGSFKLWQKPQLFLLQGTYWKQKTSQSSLRLNNLRTVLSILQNPGFQTEYLHQLKDWVHLLVIIFFYFTDIGGNVINITIVITSEKCIGGKYNKSLLLEKFKKLVS